MSAGRTVGLPYRSRNFTFAVMFVAPLVQIEKKFGVLFLGVKTTGT
jgi:hypothetical protein